MLPCRRARSGVLQFHDVEELLSVCALLGASTAVATAASAVLHNLTLDTKARQACTMLHGLAFVSAVQCSTVQRSGCAVQ